MKLSQFQFNLPADKIATEPPRWRDECKLMVLHKDSGEIEILLDLETEKTVKLRELVPDWWGKDRFEKELAK